MPELPEVETIVRLVRPSVEGRTIQGARVLWANTVGGAAARRVFGRRVRGARITRIWRRGKFFLLDLERGGKGAGHLVGHLRMSGRLEMGRAGEAPGRHDRLLLELDDGRRLRFIDVRKFGRVEWHPDLGGSVARLGPEPLDEEFTADWLYAALKGRRRALKPLLLDQAFVAGLGNIYVDESLHRARLHPLRLAHRISRSSAERLHLAIAEVIATAIRDDGSSFDTFYRTPEGQPGRFQESFRVYGRGGKPCPECGRAIRRIVVGQRGTHLCTRCQVAPRPV